MNVEAIFNRLLSPETKVVVYDSETQGLDWRIHDIVGHVITFSANPADSFYLPVRHGGGGNLDPASIEGQLNSAMKRPDLRWVGHNLSFDLKELHRHGMHPVGPLEDTQINMSLIDELIGSYTLAKCCEYAKVQAKKGEELYKHIAVSFGIEGDPTSRSTMGHFWRLSGADPLAVEYAVGDGTSTWQLWEWQQQKLDEPEPWNQTTLRTVWDIECRCIRTLHRMMMRGIKIDEEQLFAVRSIVQRAVEIASSNLPPNFNEKAPTQLVKLFTDNNITSWPVTQKGNPSFTEDWLMTTEMGRNVVAVRKYTHLRDSFLNPMIEKHLFKGRVHTSYNQSRGDTFGTITGRLSSVDPNLQAVYKRNKQLGSLYRSIFVPDDGMRMANADYKQIEPKLLAHYGRVKVLLVGFQQDPPLDAHQVVADDAKIDRESAKRLNQALITGAGSNKAKSMLGKSDAEAEQIIRDYFASMPEIKVIQKTSAEVMRTRGFVRSLLNRRAHLERMGLEYKALNRLLQCGNADVIKKSMVEVDEYFASEGDVCNLLNNIHDDLGYQFPEDARSQFVRAIEIMEDYGPGRSIELPLILTVDVGEGHDWAEATYGLKEVVSQFSKMGHTYRGLSTEPTKVLEAV